MNIRGKLKEEKFLNFSIIISLVVLNVIIKSICLSDYNIDLDEPFSLFHSQKNLAELFKIFQWEITPPLFYIILHFWIQLFGVGIVSARILPLIFSSLAVIFIYKIGNKFLSKKIAIGASLIYTFSNINIMEAHDIRVYSLFVLLTTASMYFYFSLIGSENKRRYLIALTITNILLVYSHNLAYFVIFLQVLYLFIFPIIRKKEIKEFLISYIVLFVAYLPNLYFFLLKLKPAIQDIPDPQVKAVNLFICFQSTFCNGFLLGNNFLLILTAFVLYALFYRLKFSIYEKMIFGWFIILYFLMFIASFKIQMVTTSKYLIFITPGFFITIMIAINYLSRISKFINIFLLLFCTFLMLLSTNLKYSPRLESKSAVSYILKHKSDSTLVYIFPPWIDIVFTYHYNIDAFKDYAHYTKYLYDNNIFVLSTANDINLPKLVQASDVYLIDGWNGLSMKDPNNSILSVLYHRFGALDKTIHFNGYVVHHFKTNRSDRDSIP